MELSENEIDFIIQSATYTKDKINYKGIAEIKNDYEKEDKVYLSPDDVLNLINTAFSYGLLKSK